MGLVPNLAQKWSVSERHDLHTAREHVLVALHDKEPVDFSTRIGAIATFSLMSEGYIKLDIEDPSQVQLTEAGQRFANGVIALSHG